MNVNIIMFNKSITPLNEYDWVKIQNYYDNGNSYRDVSEKFSISTGRLQKARDLGLFTPRTLSESSRLSYKLGRKKPCKHTKEGLDKLSKLMTERMENGEEGLGFGGHKSNLKRSYPEQYFYDWLNKENVNFEEKVRVGRYQLDFLIDKYIDLEIDGEQHYSTQKRINSDLRRNRYLSELGYDIIRVRWSYINSLDFYSKEKFLHDLLVLIKHDNCFIYNGNIKVLPPRDNPKNKQLISCNECGNKTYNNKFCSLSCCGKYNYRKKNSKNFSKNHNTKINWPLPEVVHQMVLDTSYVATGKELGVSDNAVRKYLRKHNLI